jgi:hypothetical protein
MSEAEELVAQRWAAPIAALLTIYRGTEEMLDEPILEDPAQQLAAAIRDAVAAPDQCDDIIREAVDHLSVLCYRFGSSRDSTVWDPLSMPFATFRHRVPVICWKESSPSPEPAQILEWMLQWR